MVRGWPAMSERSGFAGASRMARLGGLEPPTLGLEGISSVIARRLCTGPFRGCGSGFFVRGFCQIATKAVRGDNRLIAELPSASGPVG